MVNKPKPQTLRDRIEKTQVLDRVDPDLESHYNELMRALSTIGPMKSFNLLTPESAKKALGQCDENLKKLESLSKKIRAVSYLANEQKNNDLPFVNKLPPAYSFRGLNKK